MIFPSLSIQGHSLGGFCPTSSLLHSQGRFPFGFHDLGGIFHLRLICEHNPHPNLGAAGTLLSSLWVFPMEHTSLGDAGDVFILKTPLAMAVWWM